MALSPGAKLGPYEILSVAGAGGMGEVYKARDTRLDRIVAIKVLPETLLQDPGSRQRLEREARAVSVLSHPHICTLHDIGHQDGVDYLVMEYLEGETLADRLQKGPLPPDQILRCAMEIAGALDAAHRQGIVHRDLKPGNIMLIRTGAKLLDFGLAKPAAPAAGAALTAEVTRATPLTQEGAVAGTFPYMSPEQIEAKEVDARSDIFSFGSVLYEMVTGRRAFSGKSSISVASAILEREPEPISTLRPLTPPALDHVIRVCLAKDPEDRWQTARDLLLELRWVAEAGSQAGAPAPASSHGRLRERLAWTVAALGIAIAALTAVGAWRGAGVSRQRQVVRLSAELSPGTFIDRFRGAQLALSPDGTRIVVSETDPAGKHRLAMRSLDQSQGSTIPGTDDAASPFFSPDGQWLAFFSEGKLKKIPVQGGAPVTLCDAPNPMGASWGDDGTIVAALNGGSSGLVRIPSGGGAPTELSRVSAANAEAAHVWPQILPGSQAVLFTAYASGTNNLPEEGEIAVLSLESGEGRTLHRGGAFGRYLSSGHLVYLQQDTLWAASFDLGRLAVSGAPQPVLEEVNGNYFGGPDFAFSETGTLVYASSRVERSFPYSIWWLDSTGQTTPLHLEPGLYENPRISPDGRRLVFEMAIGMARADLWVKDLERDTVSRLTNLPGRNNWPVWNPDGRSLIFRSDFQPAAGLYWIRTDGAGEAQRLTDGKARQYPVSFSPDGKRLAWYQLPQDFSSSEIWTAPIEGDSDHPRLGEPVRFLEASSQEWTPAFSPDGRWLAYTSFESRGSPSEVYVRPFPGPGGKSQISSGGGSHPIWSRNGREIFFLEPEDWRIMVASYSTEGGVFTASKPRVWSQRRMAWLGGNYPYDLAPDGRRFAFVLNPSAAGAEGPKPHDSVIVLMHFLDGLRHRVPAGGG